MEQWNIWNVLDTINNKLHSETIFKGIPLSVLFSEEWDGILDLIQRSVKVGMSR